MPLAPSKGTPAGSPLWLGGGGGPCANRQKLKANRRIMMRNKILPVLIVWRINSLRKFSPEIHFCRLQPSQGNSLD